MNGTFRNALIISTVIHFLAISPLYSNGAPKDNPENDKPLTVDYIVNKELSNIEVPKDTSKPAVKETPETVSVKESAPQSSSNQDPAKKEAQKATPLLKDNAPDATQAAVEERDAAKSETRIKSTKDYADYYQIIRENIRAKLKENYKYYCNEGDVFLVFTLRKDGTVMTYKVESAKSVDDETLKGIATVSLIEAAPFPPFPKAFFVQKMSFNLIASFRK